MTNLFYLFLNKVGLWKKDTYKIKDISRKIASLVFIAIPITISINSNYQATLRYGIDPITDSLIGIVIGFCIFLSISYPFDCYVNYRDDIRKVAEEL